MRAHGGCRLAGVDGRRMQDVGGVGEIDPDVLTRVKRLDLCIWRL